MNVMDDAGFRGGCAVPWCRICLLTQSEINDRARKLLKNLEPFDD